MNSPPAAQIAPNQTRREGYRIRSRPSLLGNTMPLGTTTHRTHLRNGARSERAMTTRSQAEANRLDKLTAH